MFWILFWLQKKIWIEIVYIYIPQAQFCFVFRSLFSVVLESWLAYDYAYTASVWKWCFHYFNVNTTWRVHNYGAIFDDVFLLCHDDMLGLLTSGNLLGGFGFLLLFMFTVMIQWNVRELSKFLKWKWNLNMLLHVLGLNREPLSKVSKIFYHVYRFAFVNIFSLKFCFF